MGKNPLTTISSFTILSNNRKHFNKRKTNAKY